MNQPPTPHQQEVILNWTRALKDFDDKTSAAAGLLAEFKHDDALTLLENFENAVGRVMGATMAMRAAFDRPGPRPVTRKKAA